MAPGSHELLILSEGPFMAHSPLVMFTCMIANDKNEVDCSESCIFYMHVLHTCIMYQRGISEATAQLVFTPLFCSLPGQEVHFLMLLMWTGD